MHREGGGGQLRHGEWSNVQHGCQWSWKRAATAAGCRAPSPERTKSMHHTHAPLPTHTIQIPTLTGGALISLWGSARNRWEVGAAPFASPFNAPLGHWSPPPPAVISANKVGATALPHTQSHVHPAAKLAASTQVAQPP